MAFQYGGYKTLPINSGLAVDKFLCPFCKLLLRSPVQTGCGERFCGSCFQYLVSQTPPTCPVCESMLSQSDVFKDAFADREIKQLVVSCERKNSGCPWEGMLADLQMHDQECQFYTVQCPNIGCQEMLSRQMLNEHVEKHCLFRRVMCEFCGQEVPVGSMEDHRQSECTNAPVKCPNNCVPELFPRKKLQEHLQVCPKAIMVCPYGWAGCLFQGTREETEHHVAQMVVNHLDMVAQSHQQLEMKYREKDDYIQVLKMEIVTLQEMMKTVMSRMDNMGGGSVMTASPVMAPSEHSAQRLASAEQEMQQLRLDHHRLRESLDNTQAMSRRCLSQLDSVLVPLQNQYEQRLNNCDKAIAMQDLSMSDLSLRLDILDVKVVNGVLVWKIHDLARRRNDARIGKNASLYSAPFYTSPCGYKMCARLYLDGDGIGKGTHLSLFFVLMKSEYDALLQWPFNLKVTLMLLDQSEGPGPKRHIVEMFRPDVTSPSFALPMTEMNTGSGCPLFAPKAVLDSQNYVRDDCIFVKLIVGAQGQAYIAPDSQHMQ